MMLSRDFVRRLGSSKFNYWFGYVSNICLAMWLVSHAWSGGSLMLSPLLFAAYAGTGLLVWTLAEYALHRYVYHEWPSFLSTGHDLHHQEPRAQIGVPWYLTLAIMIALFFGLAQVFNPASLGTIMAFTWLGYVGYCIAHHASHHWPCKLIWLRQMKRHHVLHHAFPKYNWGFTTSLWDYLFGTHYAYFEAAKRRTAAATSAGSEPSETAMRRAE